MKANSQRPEPADKYGTGLVLDIHSIFYTLQGEGPFAGSPAVFVRLAGCNLQCPGCDTEYTEGRQNMPVGEVVGRISALIRERNPACKLVVITGGEPLRQNLDELVATIGLMDLHVQLETNGVFELSKFLCLAKMREMLTVIVSPKTTHCHETTMQYADAFKYVLHHAEVDEYDGLPLRALGHPAKHGLQRPPNDWDGVIYVNPQDSHDPEINKANLIAARDSALKYGHVLGVQLHKIFDLP